MSVIAEMAVNVVAKTNELAGGLNKAAGAFGGIGSKLSGMLPDLTSVNALLGGIAFGGMAAGFVSIADGLEEVLQTSQRLGVASEQYYALQIGAKNANIETETFDKGMTKLYKTLGDAAMGSKGAAKAFADLGIDVATFTKLRMDQQLGIIAQKLADMPDATQKTAAAMKLFGKAGSDLQNMLGDGAQGIRDIMAAAEDLGVNGFTEDRLARVVQFNDAMDRLRSVVGVTAQSVVIDIAPAAGEAVTALGDLITAAIPSIAYAASATASAMGHHDALKHNTMFNRAVNWFAGPEEQKGSLPAQVTGGLLTIPWWFTSEMQPAKTTSGQVLDIQRRQLDATEGILEETRRNADSFSVGGTW